MNIKRRVKLIIYWFYDLSLKVVKFLILKLKKIDSPWAEHKNLEKGTRFVERFREIISDPLNNLIERVPEAGFVKNDAVFLHNGNKVSIDGPFSYYDDFSEILIINRGVHEPLEEFCFQEMLNLFSKSPVSLELGSYWAHYSMWIQKVFPDAKCFMVEPDLKSLKCGIHNFEINGFEGDFINEFVSEKCFSVDKFFSEKKLGHLDILHSDIQGYELEMLNGARSSIKEKKIHYLFISTHSEEIHSKTLSFLSSEGYDIEVSSNFDDHTTSSDGFILASSPEVTKIFSPSFKPLGRKQIALSNVKETLDSLNFYKEK